MMEESTWFMAPGLWEMQVVKLVRILRVEVVSCFTPFKKVLFYFHTKSLKEKKRERGQGENVGLLQIISKFYKS
jgi:competence protein ComGF